MADPPADNGEPNGKPSRDAAKGDAAPKGDAVPKSAKSDAAPKSDTAPKSDADEGEIEIETHLTRDLGLPSALAIGVGTMIAAGIFTLSGLAVSEVGLCSVVGPEDEARAKSETKRLEEAKQQIKGVETVGTELIRHRSVAAGIIRAAEKYDALIIGAAGQSFSSQIMFGSIPENVARHAKCTVVVVKRHHAVKALVGRVMSE